MPNLNWDIFVNLPGAVTANFELLCRNLIHWHYARYGRFKARANQPGVEFHLELNLDCNLGEAGRWYGWQCKWFDLPSGTDMKSAQKITIENNIKKTMEILPGITDWVLCTRHHLTRKDQDWYYGLIDESEMQLHLWTESEIEEHLTGGVELLRATYFGDLVITPEALETLHKTTSAQIQHRWLPVVHQTIDAERKLRRVLGELKGWNNLNELHGKLNADALAIRIYSEGLEAEDSALANELSGYIEETASGLEQIITVLGDGDFASLIQGYDIFQQPNQRFKSFPRKLRAINHVSALSVTNGLAHSVHSLNRFKDVVKYLQKKLVCVVAEAGCGKTQLAAQLTMATEKRPAGVLLFGRNLSAGQSLDDLAKRISINGIPVAGMEALLAALDAAGQRSHCRLPVVIDGLNEAEDPRNWKGLLSSLATVLDRFPNVLVVCTLRESYADKVIPDEAGVLEIPDFALDAEEAIKKYFEYYNINPSDAEIYQGLLRHPLTLRLFCEVTNPDRESIVTIEGMASSLTDLFEKYLKQAINRISKLSPRTCQYCDQDIEEALYKIGSMLWGNMARSLITKELRQGIGDLGRIWGDSLVNALEQDGILVQFAGQQDGTRYSEVLYDALAGHLIASSILKGKSYSTFMNWIKDKENIDKFQGSQKQRHPLYYDILRALIGLVPRKFHGHQLWQMLDDPIRSWALRGAAYLDAEYIDPETCQELSEIFIDPPNETTNLFHRLKETRGVVNHPINAQYLDKLLRPMQVAQRDRRWSEWLRRQHSIIIADLEELESQWRNKSEFGEPDTLRAMWVLWTLTSTNRRLRDQATKSLYWFGRGNPKALFDLAITSLEINDPYIPERTLAACYGVVASKQFRDNGFASILSHFVANLQSLLIGPSATSPTNHWLIRHYVQDIIVFANNYYPKTVPSVLQGEVQINFCPGPEVELIWEKDQRSNELRWILNPDFHNYTLGRLFDDRRNYDMKHEGHQRAVAHVIGTAWTLGWRENEMLEIDKDIASLPFTSRMDIPRVERYGKKYSWIAFYNYAGILFDQGTPPDGGVRLRELHIDPTFPDDLPRITVEPPSWLGQPNQTDEDWVRNESIGIPDNILYRSEIDGHEGPWIAIDGKLLFRSLTKGRSVTSFLNACFVAGDDSDLLIDRLITDDDFEWPGVADGPSDYYTYAGEIPWHPTFANNYSDFGSRENYNYSIQTSNGKRIDIESLVHYYCWETQRSLLNEVSVIPIPSKWVSNKFDLRSVAQSFNQYLPDTSVASVSIAPPQGYDGHLLYLRKDLLQVYAAGRKLILFNWGWKDLYPFTIEMPDWFIEVRSGNKNYWISVHLSDATSCHTKIFT